MTSDTPLPHRSGGQPVIVVPGRETNGARLTSPEPQPRVADPGWPRTGWPVTPRPGERRHGSAFAALGAIIGLVAVAVGLIALAAPGAIRSALGWANSALQSESHAPVETPTPSPATGLDPELARRVDDARAAAAAEGIELTITSGWRSAEDQQTLVDQALDRYDTTAEAHRWVAPPEASAHVQGLAVDVGPTEGALWLQEHGAQFGLCQVFANEVWHFEPVVEPGGTCPAVVADASELWG